MKLVYGTLLMLIGGAVAVMSWKIAAAGAYEWYQNVVSGLDGKTIPPQSESLSDPLGWAMLGLLAASFSLIGFLKVATVLIGLYFGVPSDRWSSKASSGKGATPVILDQERSGPRGGEGA